MFQTQIKYKTNQGPTILLSGDFNRDQNIDVAAINRDSKIVEMLFGTGNGTLISQKFYPTGPWPSSALADDLNKNEKLDLVIVNRDSDNMIIYLNTC